MLDASPNMSFGVNKMRDGAWPPPHCRPVLNKFDAIKSLSLYIYIQKWKMEMILIVLFLCSRNCISLSLAFRISSLNSVKQIQRGEGKKNLEKQKTSSDLSGNIQLYLNLCFRNQIRYTVQFSSPIFVYIFYFWLCFDLYKLLLKFIILDQQNEVHKLSVVEDNCQTAGGIS